jgi:putative DNA primase/helicase
MSAADNFRAAMRAAGLDFAGPILPDGCLHRFKAAGDKARNSWYLLHLGTPAAGAFGCWKRGFNKPWCEREPRKMSQEQWRVVRRHWQVVEQERERTETERHAKARKVAVWILDRAKPVQSHAYLSDKGAKVFGDVRQYRGTLVLPLRDANSELHSLQFIGADGTKRFLSGGRIAGCFFTLADKPDGPLVICEGYATGASIHEATGLATVAAMNCGNLLPVAEARRAKWPDREIIIAADSDQWTEGNPGVTKAAAAAKSIRGRLAVPKFKNTSSKPTDFNDLANAEGMDTVKNQIAAACVPAESDEETLQRLAAMTPLEYERCRGAEAERLGIERVSILDKQVDRKRPKLATTSGEIQGRAMDLPDPELWHESVSGADVLNEVAETFARFVALPDGAADALALWTAHTHSFASFMCSPRLNVSSPEKGCGKTTLRDVLAVLVPRPLLAENLSVAVLFRIIEKLRPTVLADECDSWLRDNDELRGMLNSGHRRGGQALRCEGESNEVRAFAVFAPAVLCGIGALPGTLHDRSIVIRLDRAKPGELRERFDSRRTEHEQELCRKLARFCADNSARLEACDPVLPSGTFNRLADNWRPLFAVAEIVGGDWPGRATAAFANLTTEADQEAQGIGTMLLTDIQQVLAESNCPRIFSKCLIESLCAMSDRPWPEANRGKPITEAWLARRLHSFGINPRTLRIRDNRAKGYETADFKEAIERYLSSPGLSKRDIVTTLDFSGGKPSFGSVTPQNHVTGSNPDETLANIDLSRCHGSKSLAVGKPKELIEELI